MATDVVVVHVGGDGEHAGLVAAARGGVQVELFERAVLSRPAPLAFPANHKPASE